MKPPREMKLLARTSYDQARAHTLLGASTRRTGVCPTKACVMLTCALSARLPRCSSDFPPQKREQQHVADARTVREQHHDPVYAHTFARGRRQAVFERADVVGVVVHRLLVSRRFRL